MRGPRRSEETKPTGFAHARRDPSLERTRPKPYARWPPEDGQPDATVNHNLLANDECCVDGRTAAGECISARALTFDMRGGRQLAKPDVGRPLDGRVRRHRGTLAFPAASDEQHATNDDCSDAGPHR